jgi:hypothetical protein
LSWLSGTKISTHFPHSPSKLNNNFHLNFKFFFIILIIPFQLMRFKKKETLAVAENYSEKSKFSCSIEIINSMIIKRKKFFFSIKFLPNDYKMNQILPSHIIRTIFVEGCHFIVKMARREICSGNYQERHNERNWFEPFWFFSLIFDCFNVQTV